MEHVPSLLFAAPFQTPLLATHHPAAPPARPNAVFIFGDDLGYALIHSVSFPEDLALLKQLLKAGAEVNAVSGGGCWPLQDARQSSNAAALAFLLQVGTNPNLTSTGETALFAAVSSDSLECVRLLLEAGADVNATDCDGWTCLFHLRSERLAHYLQERGADPGISDQ